MGVLHEEHLQLDEAFADYSQALEVDSQVLAAYRRLARIAFREQKWQDVGRFTDQLLKLNPFAYPAAHLYNAAANFNLGNFAAAEKSDSEVSVPRQGT